MREQRRIFSDLMTLWDESKPLIAEGYRVLQKEVGMGLPGPCMPAIAADKNTGIGSPYGAGAQRIAAFFGPAVDKIQLGPWGKTYRATGHSPYMSDFAHNPFFIPLEGLLERKLIAPATLKSIYAAPKNPTRIDWDQVEAAYQKALAEAHRKSKTRRSYDDFVEQLAASFMPQAPLPYIADIQVRIPPDLAQKYPDPFLPDWTIGSPPDMFGDKPQRWGFPILNPALLFEPDGTLGSNGRLLAELFDRALRENAGGARVDHYIGFVNPYVFHAGEETGRRLYSSPKNPHLKAFAKKTIDDFAQITEQIILPCLRRHQKSIRSLYAEDTGARPRFIDAVMKRCRLGRLIVAQFADPDDPDHMYRLRHAKPDDVASLDTHDTKSAQMFFIDMDDATRARTARLLAQDLRFNYTDDLASVPQLLRMQWGALMACPARRVHAFFTSWTGQIGRYNIPNYPSQWMLRCAPDFDALYFQNLGKGMAYNPFDAISLAIYARGDSFYRKHAALVHRLRAAEDDILSLARRFSIERKTP
ncbi:MAG: 4-alpha-glucanotransferase [Alphaproteobacteria bacterium]|nr:4-alpha-glucanotransferase [Alphaproteobacteria bacterium]